MTELPFSVWFSIGVCIMISLGVLGMYIDLWRTEDEEILDKWLWPVTRLRRDVWDKKWVV